MIRLKDLITEASFKSPDYIISSTPASELPAQRVPLADVSIGMKLAGELKNWTLKKEDYKLVHYNDKVALKLTPKGKLSIKVKSEKDPNYIKLLQNTVDTVVSNYTKGFKK